jgi:hypothetical protein
MQTLNALDRGISVDVDLDTRAQLSERAGCLFGEYDFGKYEVQEKSSC